MFLTIFLFSLAILLFRCFPLICEFIIILGKFNENLAENFYILYLIKEKSPIHSNTITGSGSLSIIKILTYLLVIQSFIDISLLYNIDSTVHLISYKRCTWSVHSFNGDYLSIPESTGSCGYLFHVTPVHADEMIYENCPVSPF